MKRGSELSAFQQINFKCIFKHPWSRNVNHIHPSVPNMHVCLNSVFQDTKNMGSGFSASLHPVAFLSQLLKRISMSNYKCMERFPWSEASQFAVLLFAYDDQSLSLSIFNQWCGVFCKSKYLFESITICTIFLHTNQETSQTETTLS